MSQNDLVYLEALKASETTEAPGIGLATSTDKLSIPSGVKTLIRQNNTIIELCLKLSKQVEALEGRVRALINKTHYQMIGDQSVPHAGETYPHIQRLSVISVMP